MIYAKIDSDGFFIEDTFIEDGIDIPVNIVLTRPNTTEKGFYKARWDGEEWIEGITQEEIDALNNQTSLPSDKVRIDMLENIIIIMMEG